MALSTALSRGGLMKITGLIWGDFRRARFLGLEFGFEFLIQLARFRGLSRTGATCVELIGGFPVDQILGQFFPLATIGAAVADAVALNLIFGDRLVGAILQNQALGGVTCE